jgi:prepilin-type N-terminal cleavage/methylation domain-containing protein
MIKDMNRRGFTITELLIVITIMTILLVLGVVNLRSSQQNGRDIERKTDLETIASHLETYYTSGSDVNVSVGNYPSTDLVTSSSSMTNFLRDIDPQSLLAPGTTNPTQSFIAAINTDETTGGVQPTPSYTTYIYQPLTGTNTLCIASAACVRFNLYTKLESDNSVYKITSKNR